MAHEIPKEVWKNIHFENKTAGFSSEVSKFTSVRNKLNLSLKYWFMEAKIVFYGYHGPQKGSKCHLDIIKTSLS